MWRSAFVACVCATALTVSGLCGASADEAEEKDSGWGGELEASAVLTSGNTENQQIAVKAKIEREKGRYKHVLKGDMNYGEQSKDREDPVTFQDRWQISYQVDAQLRDKTHGYARAQYDEDHFSGFPKRWFVGVGLGQDVYDTEKLTWSVEAGPGYRWAEVADPENLPRNMRHASEEFAAFADSDLDMKLRENVSIEQNANVTYSASNTTYNTDVGLKTKLTEALSSKISYQVKYETDPPIGRESKDTMLKASLLFGF